MEQRINSLTIFNDSGRIVQLNDGDAVSIMTADQIVELKKFDSIDDAYTLLKNLGLETIDTGFVEFMFINSEGKPLAILYTDQEGLIDNIPLEICIFDFRPSE